MKKQTCKTNVAPNGYNERLCKRDALANGYCWQHQPESENYFLPYPEDKDSIMTRFVCDETGMLIEVGDARRKLTQKEINEMGKIISKGGYVKTMPYGEFKKLNLNLYEPIEKL